MRRSTRPTQLLVALFAATSIGCGEIELPITFALVGDNTISLEIPAFPPPNNVFGSSLVGGAEATVVVDLNPFELLTPNGIVAAISVDRVLMGADAIDLLGLSTGTVCIYDDPGAPGGGFALLRPLRKQADFHLTLNTLISPTSPLLLGLFPEPLPFAAAIDETIPLTLADLVGLLVGGGGGLELSQELQATLPDDIPLLAGSIITADVTLATVDAFPVDPLLDECEDFLAGP
jgi:hypothetical protein